MVANHEAQLQREASHQIRRRSLPRMVDTYRQTGRCSTVRASTRTCSRRSATTSRSLHAVHRHRRAPGGRGRRSPVQAGADRHRARVGEPGPLAGGPRPGRRSRNGEPGRDRGASGRPGAAARRTTVHEPKLYYWARDTPGAEAEVDYLVQHGTRIVPVEVKAGATGGLRSLHALMAARGWTRAVRFNADQPSATQVSTLTSRGDRATYELISLPLYLAANLGRILARTISRRPPRT